MELNSARVHPNLVEFAESMEINKTQMKAEKTHISDLQQLKTVDVVNQVQKGHVWVKNNDFFSEMLDLDPGRHKIIENDW